jgi:hypothetical protein
MGEVEGSEEGVCGLAGMVEFQHVTVQLVLCGELRDSSVHENL